MHGVVLVANSRRDVLWLGADLAIWHSTWDLIDQYIPIVGTPLGLADDLGGSFTTPPVGVAPTPDRLDVFGLGTDYSVYHKVYDAAPGDPKPVWSQDWEDLGGDLTSTPVAVSAAAGSIDLFGLGRDQAMLHRAWDGKSWTDWADLGGCFTSLPSVLPSARGHFDLFARGLDYFVYRTSWRPGVAHAWELLGGPLLGEPVAASAPAAIRVGNRIFVFVTGADGAIWYTLFDGIVWRPWSSIGHAREAVLGTRDAVSFTSEPTVTTFTPASDVVAGAGHAATIDTLGAGAVSTTVPPAITSHTRVDVFAVGNDGGLWHGFLDGQGWHGQADASGNQTGDWESVGGPHKCAPSIIAPARARTVVAMPPVRFDAVQANTNGQLSLLTFDGTSWNQRDGGPWYVLPSCYKFSVDSVSIKTTRSLLNDTDYATATLAVGRWPVQHTNQDMGDVGGGVGGPASAVLNLLQFDYVIVELCEPVALAYSIVNSGNSGIAQAVVQALLNAATDRLSSFIKGNINPPNTVTVPTAPRYAALTADVLTDVGGGIFGGIIGGVVGGALSVAITSALGIVFANCDGLVASNLIPFQKGRDLQSALAATPYKKIEHGSQHPGTDSPTGCGANSFYTVYWSITPR